MVLQYNQPTSKGKKIFAQVLLFFSLLLSSLDTWNLRILELKVICKIGLSFEVKLDEVVKGLSDFKVIMH